MQVKYGIPSRLCVINTLMYEIIYQRVFGMKYFYTSAIVI